MGPFRRQKCLEVLFHSQTECNSAQLLDLTAGILVSAMKTTATSLVVNFEQVWRQIVTFVLDRLSWEDSAIVRLLTEILKSFKDTLSIEDFCKVWPLTHFFPSVCLPV